jgi:tRNA(fMet)-specific endonuclease VapC
MEGKIILLDTSILIDYFRKQDKNKSALVLLSDHFNSFCISSVTEYEIYTGATQSQVGFWESMLQKMLVIPFDNKAARLS